MLEYESTYMSNAPADGHVPDSPTKVSKTKAGTAAAKAAEAAALAERLLRETRKSISDASLNDLKLPCIPVSPVTLETEAKKAASAGSVAPSPWCISGATASSAANASLPHDLNDPAFAQLVQAGLSSISHGAPLSFDDVLVLSDLMHYGVPGAAATDGFRTINLRGALIPSKAPPLPDKRLKEVMATIENEVGPEDVPENVEALQARVEKAKGEFTNYEAGIRFLATKKLDRVATLCQALIRNSSLVELNLSGNRLGAPNDENRSNYRELRQFAKVFDDTPSIASLDLSGNQMGPVGVGIVAKALTKNITISTLNLSGNDVALADPPEEEEDPDKEEDDPVFGEYYNGLEALSEMLKKNKFLRVISLRNNNIKSELEESSEEEGWDTPLGKFLDPLRKYHRIEVLDLACNDLGPAGAKMLATALLQNHSVRTLDISDNSLGLAGLAHITRLVNGSATLSTLCLQKNDIAAIKKESKRAKRQAVEIFTAFGKAMANSVSLRNVNLSGHQFGVEYSCLLLAGIAQSRITSLTYTGNDLCGSPEDLSAALTSTRVASLLSSTTTAAAGSGAAAVMSLYATTTAVEAAPPAAAAVSDGGATEGANGNDPLVVGAGDANAAAPGADLHRALDHIIDAMRRTADEPMRIVNLSGNHLGVTGAQRLAVVLPNAVSVDISRNDIGDAGLAAICETLCSGDCVCMLENLDVSHNGLGHGSASILSSLIPKCPTLKQLNCGSNRMFAAPLDDFAAFLHAVDDGGRSGGFLKALNLCSNGLHTAHVPAISQFCENAVPPFGSLDLLDNPGIALQDAVAIVSSLAANDSIHTLRISSQYGDRTALVDAAMAVLSRNHRLTDLDLCLSTDLQEKYVQELKHKLLHNALIGVDPSLR